MLLIWEQQPLLLTMDGSLGLVPPLALAKRCFRKKAGLGVDVETETRAFTLTLLSLTLVCRFVAHGLVF